MAMLSLITGGVFERFPRLRTAYMEAGSGWLPFWLHRIEEHMELSGWMEAPECTMTPKEYFKRNCYISTECDEELVYHVVEELGDDRIVFETDYPHPDSEVPAGGADLPRPGEALGRDEAEDPVGQRGRLLLLPRELPAHDLRRGDGPRLIRTETETKLGPGTPQTGAPRSRAPLLPLG